MASRLSRKGLSAKAYHAGMDILVSYKNKAGHLVILLVVLKYLSNKIISFTIQMGPNLLIYLASLTFRSNFPKLHPATLDLRHLDLLLRSS